MLKFLIMKSNQEELEDEPIRAVIKAVTPTMLLLIMTVGFQ